MSPIKVFLSIFASGILLAVILGVVGMYQPTDIVEQEENVAVDILAGAPTSLTQNCLSCHGNQLQGGVGPGLIGLDLTEEDIIDILVNGQGTMQAQDYLTDDEMQDIATYLVQLDE